MRPATGTGRRRRGRGAHEVLQMSRDDLLYLSAEAVDRAGGSFDALREACAAGYVAKAAGGVRAEPKVAVTIGPGHAFQAMPVALPEAGVAAVKWVGVTPAAEGRPPGISALVVLSDTASGEPLAIMDG